MIHENLPVHPYHGPWSQGDEARLRIDGLVQRAIELRAADLVALPRTERAEPFACEEGWTVPDVRWRGMLLSAVIELAGSLPSARYVRVHSGEFVVPVSLSDAPSAMICDEMNGEPLTREHGAPWRLFVPGDACFTSVKWVERLEVTAEPGERAGERIARARLRTDAST
ncbi:hypothetical protein EPN42_07490 [bacterium]|nr:MAG: hypothetical protein EPN42_07490 [bacterium]